MALIMSTLSRDAVLEQFDRLQQEGELFYTPSQPIPIKDGDLDFEFRLVPSFNSKPQLNLSGSQTETAQSSRRPKPSDGSDIDHSDPAFFVAYVNSTTAGSSNVSTNIDDEARTFTHKLILNKFCVFRPQYILLTTDPLQKQTSRLDENDLRAAWTVIQQLKEPRPHYVIFNCGREGGSSRAHKHMQLLEEPSGDERPLMWPHVTEMYDNDDEWVMNTTSGTDILSLPFLAFKTDVQRNGGASLTEAYRRQYRAASVALSLSEVEDFPHNVVLTTDWIVLIPRTKATVDGIEGHVINATGMMGLVWCGNEAQFEGWKKTGPEKVLARLGTAHRSV